MTIMKTMNTIYTNFAKRVLITLIAAVTINIGSIFAVEVTFLPSDFNGKGTITSGSEMSITKDGVTFHCDKGYGDPDDFRCYKGGTITISSSKKITSISFTCTKADYDGNLEATYSDLNTYSWSQTLGEQARIKTCVVTYSAEDSGETPGGDSSDDLLGEDGEWVLVTNVSDLKIGDEIIIAAKDYDYALSTEQRSANRGATAIQKYENTLKDPSDNVQILILQAGTESNTWAFHTGNGFLYASSSSANELKTQDANNANGSWSISISDEVASIVSSGSTSRDVMQFNAGTTPKIFSCYATASQAALVIYKHISCSNEVTLSKGNEINATITSINPKELQTCSEVAAERQVTITAKANTGYLLNENSVSLTGSVSATRVSFDATTCTYVYQFEKDASGEVTISVTATAKTTTISFDQNGGEGGQIENKTATYDQPMPTQITLPTSYSHKFIGYFDAKQGGTKYYNADGTSAKIWDKIDANYTLYAQWTAKKLINYRTLCTYEITYEETYGVDHSNPATYTAADLSLKFEAPTSTREGYTFKGWDPATLSAETRGDQVVEAQWTVNQYTVTWKLNGGQWQGGTDDRVNNHNFGAKVTKPVDPSRTGYTFTGWSPAEIPATMPAENLEFTAQWTPTPYTVTWKLGKENYHTSNVDIENPLSIAPENPSDGDLGCCADKFMGWSSQQSPSAGDIFTKDNIPSNVTTAKTYYAVFATTAQGVGTSIADFSEMGYENGTALTDPIVLGDGEGHGDATITLAKAQSSSNAPTYYTDGEAVRIYAGGTITIASSYHIKNVAFTFATGDGSNEITANSGTYADGVWTENVESPTNNLIITIGGEAGQHRRIASITVTTGVSGSQYTNYVTQCTALPNPALSGGSVPAIAVNCGDFSTLNNSQAITFSTMQNLTCPVTFEVIDGDFLISTAKDRAAQYQSKITVTPTKSGENIGKLKNVYVRANATDHNENFTGKIKVTSDELTEDVIINLTADVTCEAFTITTVDHLGNKTVSGTYFAGEVIATRPTPSSDACTAGYTFDGWSTAEVKYGSVAYAEVTFPYTMPNHDVTLYPVYQVNTTADYHRVTSDLGANNWAGDYLIAASADIFASGKTNELLQVGLNDLPTIIDEIISADWGQAYDVSLIAVEGGYVLKTQDISKPYIYITNAQSAATSQTATESTAASYPLDVQFNSVSDIRIYNPLSSSGKAISYYGSSKSFGFYKQTPIYLYRKSPLYTSSLICEEITAENAMVTSTAGQTVKVNVTATMTNTTVNRTRTLTVESDNADFTATITKTATNTYNVAVSYNPSAEDNKDGTKTATITIKVNNIPVTTFQVTGRHLPETFAIVAKVGNIWYALPSQGLNSETTPVDYPVKVDNNDNPTVVTSLPTKAEWALRNVYKVNGQHDRFAANGENLVFVNAENKTLYASKDNANIQTYAEYTSYAKNNPERYEWVPTTTDLTNYTLKNVGRDKDLSINVNATFGTHASNIASNNLRFLPINATYNPFDMQVVEWYPTKVQVQTEAALTSVSATIGGVAVANPDVTKKGGKLYEISGLPLENNPTKILTISYDSYSCSKVIPIIISRATKSVKDAPFSTLTKAIYNYSDLVVRDGATLTINGTKQAPDKFVNVTIYPTAKIVVPENNQLSVYSLTFFGGIDDIYDGEKYTTNKYGVPQLSLKGTLGKTVTTMDYIMRVNTDQMYSLGLPYDVALADIKYWDGSAIGLGTQLYVSAYDGQARANREKKTWIYETDFETKLRSATLKAGVGYTISAEPQAGDAYSILRMPMKSNISSGSTEGEKTVSVTGYANNKGATITDNHKGWNLLSNPYMTTISGDMGKDQLVIGYLIGTNWVADTYRYVTIPGDNGKWYYQQKFTDATLLPFKSFFVQVKEDVKDGNLSFDLANRQNAPARFLQQDMLESVLRENT